MTTQTLTKRSKTKKTTPKKEVVFTKDDFFKALDKVISAPIPTQTSKKQPEKVRSEK